MIECIEKQKKSQKKVIYYKQNKRFSEKNSETKNCEKLKNNRKTESTEEKSYLNKH